LANLLFYQVDKLIRTSMDSFYIQRRLALKAGAYFMKMSFKNVFELKHDQIIGLDIGSCSIKILQLQKEKNGFSVLAAAKTDISVPKGFNPNSIDINVVKAVRECFQLSSVRSAMSVCSVCGPEVAVRRFRFPPLPSDEIYNAVMLEAAQVCPFSVNDSVVDYQIIPNGHGSIRGILVAATGGLVKKKKWYAEEASLRTVLMDVDGLALLNCLHNCQQEQKERRIAVLNVGGSYTTLAMADNDKLPFIRDIAYGGSDIIGNLASQLGVESEDIQKSILMADERRGDNLRIKEVLPIACQKLVDDMTETLRYYSANEKAQVDEIYITGGFSLVDGFVELLKSSFKLDVRLWNPFESFPGSIPEQYRDFLKKEGSVMAVAAGLAMRTI
jgi:type IV pilus assembly protein PilM